LGPEGLIGGQNKVRCCFAGGSQNKKIKQFQILMDSIVNTQHAYNLTASEQRLAGRAR
jgi:hypothetical protein